MRATCLALLLATASCGLGANQAMPIVTGRVGAKPVIHLPSARPEGRTHTISVLEEGSGRPSRRGDVVLTDVEVRQWTGNEPYLNTYDTHQPTTVVFDGEHVSKTWEEALIGRRPGSRVLLVSPAVTGFGPDGPPANVDPGDTLVLLFDVLGGYAPDARLEGRSLPAVPDDPRPGVPVEGRGEVVRPGARLVVQYVGADLASRQVYDSSYRRGGPNAVTLLPGAVPPGWLEALVGERVGSRVVLTVPAARTRGFGMTTGGMGVPEGRDLIYVVDVLDQL
ncbi:hypothetical protein GCM10022248_16280 [Nonomuraea soli]